MCNAVTAFKFIGLCIFMLFFYVKSKSLGDFVRPQDFVIVLTYEANAN